MVDPAASRITSIRRAPGVKGGDGWPAPAEGLRRPERRVEQGRTQFRDRAWDDAYDSLVRADAVQPLEVEDLERLAWSAALTGRDPEFLRLLERSYQTYLGCGRETAAARAAFWICFRLFAIGEAGRAGGWLARSQRLADAHDCVERGYLMMPAVHRHMADGDNAAARSRLTIEAAAIGDRFRDADLSAFARGLQGARAAAAGRDRSRPGAVRRGDGGGDQRRAVVAGDRRIDLLQRDLRLPAGLRARPRARVDVRAGGVVRWTAAAGDLHRHVPGPSRGGLAAGRGLARGDRRDSPRRPARPARARPSRRG